MKTTLKWREFNSIKPSLRKKNPRGILQVGEKYALIEDRILAGNKNESVVIYKYS